MPGTEEHGVVWNQADVCRVLGVSDTTLRQWIAAGKATPSLRTASGFAVFTNDDVRKLRAQRAAGRKKGVPLIA